MKTKNAVNLVLKSVGQAGLDGIEIKAATLVAAVARLLEPAEVNYAVVAKELRRQKLIELQKRSDHLKLSLTPAGAYRLTRAAIDEIRIPQPKTWDKKWRMVSFDIPLNRSASRQTFTKKLEALGFYMLQRSLWVYPFACFEQVTQLAEFYNLQRHCSFFEISALDQLSSRRLKQHFSRRPS